MITKNPVKCAKLPKIIPFTIPDNAFGFARQQKIWFVEKESINNNKKYHLNKWI